jgi:acyl dehydratase
MKFEELKIGQSYEMKRTFTLQEVSDFVKLSYDTNPIHTDVEYAQTTQFGQIIVPGFLTGSLFSAIIGARFPGYCSIYLNQNMSFRSPVFLTVRSRQWCELRNFFPKSIVSYWKLSVMMRIKQF